MTRLKPFVPWAMTASRVIIGGLFVWAALTKIGDLHAFAEEIANYQLVPARLVPLIAAALPGVELVVGVALVLGLYSRASAGIISALMLVFIVGISQALIRGIDLTCGCFGGADDATWGTVWRDVAMLVPAVLVLLFGPGKFAMQPEQTSARQVIDTSA